MKACTSITLTIGMLLVACDEQNEGALSADRQPIVTKSAQRPQLAPDKSNPPPSEEAPTDGAIGPEVGEIFTEANKIQNPKDREKALTEAIWKTIGIDPALSAEAFLEMPSGSEQKNQLIEHFATRLADGYTEQAKLWANSLENEEDKSLAFGEIAIVIAQKDPKQASQILSESGVGGPILESAVAQITRNWLKDSPPAAAKWITELNDNESRHAGMEILVASWTPKEPQKALEWVSSIEDSEVRKEAVDEIAEIIAAYPEQLKQQVLDMSPADVKSKVEELNSIDEQEVERSQE
jgi:hypothetical protein